MSARESRRESDLLSVDALVALLKEVASNPSAYLLDHDLRRSLRSQGSLARRDAPNIRIVSMSLNHQKAIAEIRLGSYEVLDNLRKAAAVALEDAEARTSQGSVATKASLRELVRELEEDRQTLLQDLFVLQRAYDLRCVQARAYAQAAGPATQERCRKEQRELDATFSLRKKSVPSDNVASMEEVRNRVRP